jgi:hypothetical protein
MNAQHPTPPSETDARLARLHDAYAEKVSTAEAAGRDDLVREFAAAYETESAELTGAHTLERRPPRRSLRARFDSYTLEVMNPGHPYRRTPDRSV